MQFRKLKAALAIVAATAGAGVLASGADAAIVKRDNIQLYQNKNLQLNQGYMLYEFSHGQMTAHLTGTLAYQNQSSACVRAHIWLYDGSTLLDDKHGQEYCPTKDLYNERPVDLSDTDATGKVDKVVVAVERKTASVDWTIKDQQDAPLAPTFLVSPVQLVGNGISVTGQDYNKATDKYGTCSDVEWSVEDGKASAVYTGDVEFNGFSNSGRVELHALDESGKVIETVDGDPHQPADLGKHVSKQDTLAITPSPDLDKIELVLQSSPDKSSWKKVTSQTVALDLFS
jgi:hypothetical protein